MKNVMKTLASVLVFSIILQTAVIGFEFDDLQRNPDSKSNSDPYALMYDSNEKLAEKIESMPDVSTEVQVSEESEAPSKGKPASGVATEDADGRIVDKDSKKELLDIVSTGELDKISELDISDEMKAEIEVMNESVKADRFIVKYSSETKGSMPSLIAKESDKYKVSNNECSGKTELLILDEKVNPKEFADTLKNAGADSYIEYIQPDFKLEYAATDNGIELVLSEVEPSVSVEGDEPDAGESVDKQQDDAVETESPAVSASPELPTEPVVVPEEITPEVIEIPTETPLPEQLSEVIVAVIDTGIDVAHPGLADYIWNNTGETDGDGIDNDGNGFVDDIKGWNFYDDSNAIYDSEVPLQSAHGTHIAGIITETNEDYNVKIMPLQVFGDSGAYTSDIIDAIHYAEANGARIVNCSFGSTDNNPALSEAIESSDMLFVCAVGNARSDLAETPIYPACFEQGNIISVTSTNADGGLSYYSNYSAETIDVAALGRDVNSTLPDGEYGNQSGTSMAAAQVSGVAAATLSVQNDLDANRLKQRLIDTSDMLSNLQETVIDGRQINLDNAVGNLEQTEIIENNPADDFDVKGYNPTQDELYQLYTSSGDVVQIAAGTYHTLVLKENGTVWTWGANNYGQCGNGRTLYSEGLTQVIGLTNVTYLEAGSSHSVAVKSDGTVWAWGYNSSGQLGDGTTTTRTTPVQVNGLTGVAGVGADDDHNIVFKTDGTVWSWGENYYGQLGDGSTTNRNTPVQVSGLTNVVGVAAGRYDGLAVKSDGTVWFWGVSNSYWMEGSGEPDTIVVTPEQWFTDVTEISANDFNNLALKSNGTVIGWGDNDYGQVGSSDPISGLTNVVSIAAGGLHSLAVKSDGTVWSLGCNNDGQLGDGSTTTRYSPVQVSGLTGVVSVTAGTYHSVALKSDGTVWAWGYNNYGQLGDGSTTRRITPVRVSSLTGVAGVAAGSSHSLAFKYDGTVWAWGSNNYGQLGDGSTTRRIAPVRVSSLNGVVGVAAGSLHSLAVKSDGTVWAWGYNDCGQLGDGTTTNRITPVQVSGLTDVIQVAVADSHSLAVKSDGTVWAWGNNDYGKLGDGTTTDRTTPVQVSGLAGVIQVAGGSFHSLAVKSDGTVWAWGYNSFYGRLGDGTTTSRTTPVQVSGLTGVIQVAGGSSHSLAVKSDGTVWAWGNNDYGQLGDGTATYRITPVQVSGLAGVIQVAGGSFHSLAVKSDGTVWAWGYNDCGQLGDGTTTVRITPVQMSGLTDTVSAAAGDRHSLAVKSNMVIWSCGLDYNGQLGVGSIVSSSIPIQSKLHFLAIAFTSESYTASISAIMTRTITTKAQATDEYGTIISNADITYSLGNTYTGVSINRKTGVVTITNQAQAGQVQINATYGNLSCSTTLTLVSGVAGSNTELSLSATTGDYYYIKLTARNVSSFVGQTYTLTYDDSALEVLDLCASTYDKESTTGAIPSAGVTITSFSPGEIVFTIDKAIPSGKAWSGALNTITFKALTTQTTSLHIA